MEHIIHTVFHTIIHSFLDSVKILPFLFLTYIVLEYIEHKAEDKTERFIKNTGKGGPFFGALIGIVPQCGFSALASGLYAGGIVSVGTLLAVFLSTSDEMLPILLSEKVPVRTVVLILFTKFAIALVAGFVADLFIKSTSKSFHEHCECEGCHCEKEGIFKSALFHTVKIFAFIFVISTFVHLAVEALGEDTLGKILTGAPILSCLFSAIVGLVPNCASSVILTELYVEGFLSLGAMMSGLLVGSGTGILVLFKMNPDKKDTLRFVLLLLVIGIISGVLIDTLGLEVLF